MVINAPGVLVALDPLRLRHHLGLHVGFCQRLHLSGNHAVSYSHDDGRAVLKLVAD